MTFTVDDFDVLATAVTDAWRSGLDRDWSARAGTLDWSCTETADHTVDAVLAVGFFLASRRQDGYPDWWKPVSLGPDPHPADLVEAVETVSRLVSAVIRTSPPDVRAVIWQRPRVESRGPEDFAARAGLELVLHGHDVCTGLGVPLVPPPDALARLRDHTRGWPHWTAPGWSSVPTTDDPWQDLLVASGR